MPEVRQQPRGKGRDRTTSIRLFLSMSFSGQAHHRVWTSTFHKPRIESQVPAYRPMVLHSGLLACHPCPCPHDPVAGLFTIPQTPSYAHRLLFLQPGMLPTPTPTSIVSASHFIQTSAQMPHPETPLLTALSKTCPLPPARHLSPRPVLLFSGALIVTC